MARDDYQMKLRLPADMRDRLKALASQSKRSMNAEIVQRLEESIHYGYALEIDFETGGTRKSKPESWYREYRYSESNEEEIIKAVMHFTDELQSAVHSLRRRRALDKKD